MKVHRRFPTGAALLLTASGFFCTGVISELVCHAHTDPVVRRDCMNGQGGRANGTRSVSSQPTTIPADAPDQESEDLAAGSGYTPPAPRPVPEASPAGLDTDDSGPSMPRAALANVRVSQADRDALLERQLSIANDLMGGNK